MSFALLSTAKTPTKPRVYSILNVRQLFITVVPTIQLELGSNLNPDDIEEGDDVYFECKVHANPVAYKVVWRHNVSTPTSLYVYRRLASYFLHFILNHFELMLRAITFQLPNAK